MKGEQTMGNRRSILILSLLFQVICANISVAQWFHQNSGTTTQLHDITFIDRNNGYAVGSDGTIIHTTDAGMNWSVQQSGTTVSLQSVFFIDENNGWTVEGANHIITPGAWAWGTQVESATILRTTNGGLTWDRQTSGISVSLGDVCFIDKNNGIIVGGHRRNASIIECVILKTTDGGHNWTTQYADMKTIINRVCFADSISGIAVGTSLDSVGLKCAIFRTTDGGSQWNRQSVGIEGVLYGVSFGDDRNGIAVGTRIITHEGLVLRTTDGGTTWISQPTLTTSVLTGVCFTDVQSATIVGGAPFDGEDIILRTTDGGNTWISLPLNSTNHLSEVCFVDAATGWIVGWNGTILHTTSGGVTYVKQEKITSEVPKGFSLYQNYPNPFNPTTAINYQLAVGDKVTLKVYDVLGNEVATLVNEVKPAGTYEVTWNARNLSSGAYYYQLKAGSYVETKKMLMSK
jgi:photosystem II stability/assembly factor-like uncharacterized protein